MKCCSIIKKKWKSVFCNKMDANVNYYASGINQSPKDKYCAFPDSW